MRKIWIAVATVMACFIFVSLSCAVSISGSVGSGSYQWSDSNSSALFTNGNTFGAKLRVGLTQSFGVGLSYTTWETETIAVPRITADWTATDLTADYTFWMVPVVKPYIGAGVGNYTSSFSGGGSSSDMGLIFFGGVSVKILKGLYIDYGLDYHTIFTSGQNTQMTGQHFGIALAI